MKKYEILDKVEKKYLGAVIRPYNVDYIKKGESITEEFEFLVIRVNGELMCGETIMLPYFPKGTMYQGMEVGKEYSLQELGL